MKRRTPSLILSIFAILFLLSLGLSTGLHIEENLLSLLPSDDPMVENFHFIAKKFRLLDSLYIDIGTEDLSEKGRGKVAQIADRLYETLHKSGLLKTLHYRMDSAKTLELLENLETKKAQLFSMSDLAELEHHLKEGEIKERLARAKRQLMEVSGSFLVKKIRRDPLNTTEILLEKLRRLGNRGSDVQVQGGRLFSTDRRHILMIALPRCAPTDSQANEKLVSFLQETRKKLLQGISGVHIAYVGGHIATRDNTVTIKRDVWRTMTAITLSILLLGLLFFRQKIFIGLVFFPAAFGVTFALGVLSLFSSRLSGVAFGCGAILVGITVDYGVHLLFHLDNATEEEAAEKTVRRLIRPLIMGSGTTIGAFFCLFLSSLPGQRDMGYVAVLGVFGAVIFSIFPLKYLVPARRKERKQPLLPLAAGCKAFLLWRKRNSLTLLALGIFALVASLFGIHKTCFDGNVDHLSHLNHQNRADENHLAKIWGKGFSASALVVRGKTLEEALVANDRLAEDLKKLTTQGLVSSFSSLSPILPSLKTQRENRERWDSFWSAKRLDRVKSDFRRASEALDFSEKAFSPFFESLTSKRPPVFPEEFKGSGFDWLIQSRIVSEGQQKIILTTLTTSERANLKKIEKHLKGVLPDCIFMDKKQFVEHTTHQVKTEFKKLLLVAALAILVMLYLFFGRIELVLAVLFPVLLSSAMTLGVLGFLEIPLNLFSILFIIFVFGVGIDFSIFLLTSALSEYRYEGELSAITCGSVILCALTTLCAFVTLSFSTHPALFSIGITGLIGMSLSLVVSLTFIPVFVDLLLFKEGRYGTPSFKKLMGAVWAFLFLASLATVYNWFLRFFLPFWYWRDPEKKRAFARRYMHFVASLLLKTYPYLDSKRIFIDAGPEKFAQPSVIVSNHLSAFDIMVILALPANMIMIVKKWVWRAPFLGQLVRDAGYLLVGQDSPEALLEKCADSLKKGVSVMVFPEGTRSKNGQMGRFHKGAFEIATKTNSPVIPVLLTNTQACIPRISFWIGDHQVVIRALAPITPENFDYTLGARKLSKYTKEKMAEFQHQDWRLAQEGPSFWHNLKGLYNYMSVDIEMYIHWKLRLDPIYRHLDKLVNEEGLVFDLGCGYGLSSNILAWKSRKRQVIGVDLDEQKIHVAQRTALASENVEFVLADFQEWESSQADTLVMIDVLHYWNKETQQTMIARACQWLKPGGTLVFRDMCATGKWDHKVTKWTEAFAIIIGHNRQGDNFSIGDRQFYLEAFLKEGLKLDFEAEELGRGSNLVFVFRKDH